MWGETFVHVFRVDATGISITGPVGVTKTPVVEACLSVDFSYIRQWDGRHSGSNHRVPGYISTPDVEIFVRMVRMLAARAVRTLLAIFETLTLTATGSA